MKTMKFSVLVATWVAILTVFSLTFVSAQQKQPEKMVKKTEQKMALAIPVKQNPEVAKDSTSEKKVMDRKMNKMMPKPKPPGK
jgi:hypothetical protein